DEDGVDDSGDVWLFSRVRRLADPNLSSPLIELDRLETLRRSQTARLTEAGKDVLEGRANAIELNGIDDWVGGTYLDSSRGEVWVRTTDGLERQRDLS
ncbi:MAG TPA: hypothetical protein VK116_17785, partial [Planctomycetota bacterium]|nr:hypothetical protein [Planctomycetota bacterium]